MTPMSYEELLRQQQTNCGSCGCAELKSPEFCGGWCESCAEDTLHPEYYCDYCEMQYEIDRMCSRDDYHDLNKAAVEVHRAKEELKRAEEVYAYIKNHVKQSH
jgi:hypothetical protein